MEVPCIITGITFRLPEVEVAKVVTNLYSPLATYTAINLVSILLLPGVSDGLKFNTGSYYPAIGASQLLYYMNYRA